MRTPHHDPELIAASGTERHAPERRCVLSGAHDTRDALLRLALSPEGVIVPDIAAKAPGRGAWIAVDRDVLAVALAKGKLKGALARAFKGAPVAIPVDLVARIDAAYLRTLLNTLGLASKAGVLLTGADKIDGAARGGKVALLCHASDAAVDGRRKRDQSWRVGMEEEGRGREGRILPIDRTALSVALGRDNAVHIAIIDAGWAMRLGQLLDRWHRFGGSAKGGPEIADGNSNQGDAEP